MILRRFMKHVTDQNWFAVGLDVIVVITGIFLGMQVTDWNEERKEDQAKADMVLKLRDDFDVIVTQTHLRVGFHEDVVEDLQYLLQVLDGDINGEPDAEKIRLALSEGEFSWGNPGESATWQALVASGRQDWIENEALRQSVIEYHRNLAESEGAYQELRIAMTEYSRDFKRYYRLENRFDSRALLDAGSIGPNVTSYDLGKMNSDPAFRKAVEQYMRLQYVYLVNHDNNRRLAEASADLLRESK